MELKKKLGKKILALGMTFAICFSSVTGSIPMSFSETSGKSDEPDSNLSDGDFEQLKDETAYTVTIADSKNGRLYFYDSEGDKTSDETEKSFLVGDKIELIPEAEEGFTYVNSAKTNKNGIYENISQSDGEDNVITFIMPDYDTTVKGVFNEGTFIFNGITTLEGKDVTGNIGDG